MEEKELKKVRKQEQKKMKDEGVRNMKEWDTTRRLYAQLSVLSVAQLLLRRVEHRMLTLHGLLFHQKQKQLLKRATGYIDEAGKCLDEIEVMASRLGYGGDKEFVNLNTLLNREAYSVLRLILNWQNATKVGGKELADTIEEQLNDMSRGCKRDFSKKLIDTFKLEEDKK